MILQTAKVLALASLLACLTITPALAQSARLEVTATVVDATSTRAANASARWLAANRTGGRKDLRLATVVVNRDRRMVLINYLRN
jgi:hypothetical protein